MNRRRKKEEVCVSETQPFVLNSAEGQFMVLQKLNSVASQECKEWLQQSGQSEFKTILDEAQERGIFEPVDSLAGQNWSPVDTNTCKLFVHNFFAGGAEGQGPNSSK